MSVVFDSRRPSAGQQKLQRLRVRSGHRNKTHNPMFFFKHCGRNPIDRQIVRFGLRNERLSLGLSHSEPASLRALMSSAPHFHHFDAPHPTRRLLNVDFLPHRLQVVHFRIAVMNTRSKHCKPGSRQRAQWGWHISSCRSFSSPVDATSQSPRRTTTSISPATQKRCPTR